MDISLQDPYAEPGGGKYVWLRGNLHTHSTRSDGKRHPQQIIDAYAAYGHQFLALSDHDIVSDYSSLDPRGMVLLQANEISASGCHLLHIGARQKVNPSADRQEVLEKIVAAGGYAIMNHPDWENDFDHCPYETLLALKGYCGIEIYNAGILEGPGSPYGVNKWDRLLATGRMVWGHASDDSHDAHHENRGWDMVRVPAGRITPEAILEAYRAGRFYASSGVIIERIETDGPHLRVVAPGAEAIAVMGEYGRRLAYAEGPALSYDVSKTISPHVRVQCYGFADLAAWTQPFVIKGGPAERLRKLTAEKPVLNAARAGEMPRGPDDPAWKNATESQVPYRGGDAGKPEVATSVRCLATKTHVVFCVRCEEPFMDKVKAIVADGDPNMWTDDSIELFLDVDAKAVSYFHLMANPLGHHWAGHTRVASKKPVCACRTTRGSKEWALQVAVALDSLGPDIHADPGTRWGFHLCRSRTATRQNYFWSWTGGSNHTPSAFGWLQF